MMKIISFFTAMLFISNAQLQVNLTSAAIGNQIWMNKNLDASTYRNGAPPEVSDSAAWALLTTRAWCHYDNDLANDAVYGKLYNWYIVNDSRGLAHGGWHVPDDKE